ncbi:F-box/LRR-repeat protein At3g26922-like isoform X7 [Salvia miltiorrhiza]|uniref:F-box/LRR-repeat protein At3g26922-like isoform X7 n=1 Tax=Salvia miltiorrhiza TaxID=226208 RepID=UPI0025AC7397|nr:F-box/LRR-repeat protein At3g26922-like isoform X7 [Salvia miltiorrhiza]
MDRLSELPDSIIFHIFWSLPMTDVVRTTFLSKRWKNLWTTAPYLNFDNRAMDFDDGRELQNFVNRALVRWNGVLGAMIKRCMNSSFPNVNSLHLGFCFNDYKLLLDLLESFPQLKKLVLEDRREYEIHKTQESLNFDANSYLNFEAYPPESFLQLRTVEVTWNEDDKVFPFIEFLLKYASNLEKMVFRVKRTMPPQRPSKSLFWVSQKLLRMPRSSPTAQLIFCDDRNATSGN